MCRGHMDSEYYTQRAVTVYFLCRGEIWDSDGTDHCGRVCCMHRGIVLHRWISYHCMFRWFILPRYFIGRDPLCGRQLVGQHRTHRAVELYFVRRRAIWHSNRANYSRRVCCVHGGVILHGGIINRPVPIHYILSPGITSGRALCCGIVLQP